VRTPAQVGPRLKFAPILTASILTVLLLWLFFKTADVFILLFIGVLISLYLSSVADFVARRTRMPRPVAIALAILLTIVGLVGLVLLLVPPVIEQTQALVKVLPDYISTWEKSLDNLAARYPALSEVYKPGENRVLHAVYDQFTTNVGNVVPRVFGLFHAALNVFAVAVIGLYLTLYPGVYREWLIAFFPPVHRDLVRDLLGDLGDILRAYIVGQIILMAVLGVLTAIGLYLLDVPYYLTFGVFTGLALIVPFFGGLLSTLLPALFVLGQPNGGTHALLVIGLGVVIHLVEANIVSPLVMANKVKLPPVLTIMAVLVIGKLLGPLGLLIAVPTLAVLMVIVRRILLNRVYEGQGFRRAPRDRMLLLRVPAPEGGVLLPDNPVDVVSLFETQSPRHVA
jgi:predicted PurR-regulated permease PerM